MSEEGAREVAQTAAASGIKLSVHAPYYINFNAHDSAILEASMGRLLQSCRIGARCGAVSVVVHSAFYLGDPPKEVFKRVKQKYEEAVRQLRDEKIFITIRPEVMGKGSEFGSLDEVLALCSEVKGLEPGIDFAHLHAAEGKNNSYREFALILDKVEQQLGPSALQNLHIHCSGVKYGPKGELSHLDLKESDLAFGELIQALRDRASAGLVICESPSLEDDALLLQKTYTLARRP
jgi:deoxyribonuclease-4